jgi:hypothetical protein
VVALAAILGHANLRTTAVMRPHMTIPSRSASSGHNRLANFEAEVVMQAIPGAGHLPAIRRELQRNDALAMACTIENADRGG